MQLCARVDDQDDQPQDVRRGQGLQGDAELLKLGHARQGDALELQPRPWVSIAAIQGHVHIEKSRLADCSFPGATT